MGGDEEEKSGQQVRTHISLFSLCSQVCVCVCVVLLCAPIKKKNTSPPPLSPCPPFPSLLPSSASFSFQTFPTRPFPQTLAFVARCLRKTLTSLDTMNIAQPVAAEITGVHFSFYDPDEIKRLSVKHLVNPTIFDNLNRPTRGGLYDPSLGPFSKATR